jgi:hypothetical protein
MHLKRDLSGAGDDANAALDNYYDMGIDTTYTYQNKYFQLCFPLYWHRCCYFAKSIFLAASVLHLTYLRLPKKHGMSKGIQRWPKGTERIQRHLVFIG